MKSTLVAKNRIGSERHTHTHLHTHIMWTRAARLGVSGIQQRASAHRHHHYHHQHNHHHHRRRLSGALLSNFTRTNTSRSECGLGFVQSQTSRQGRLRQPVFSSTTNCATRSAPLTRTFSSRTGQQARPDVVLDGALKIASSTLRSAASAVAVFAAVIAVTSGSSTQVAFASKRARQDRKERVSGSLRALFDVNCSRLPTPVQKCFL